MAWIAKRPGMCFAAFLITLQAAPSPGATPPPADHADIRVAQCIRKAARGVRWLERTLWGLRDQEGGWVGAEITNADGSHDLGVLQINSWWVPRLARLLDRSQPDVRRWLVFDPCFNAEAARWIFLSGLRASHDYWTAVGIYHSPSPNRRTRYAHKVAGHLRARFGANVFATGRAP